VILASSHVGATISGERVVVFDVLADRLLECAESVHDGSNQATWDIGVALGGGQAAVKWLRFNKPQYSYSIQGFVDKVKVAALEFNACLSSGGGTDAMIAKRKRLRAEARNLSRYLSKLHQIFLSDFLAALDEPHLQVRDLRPTMVKAEANVRTQEYVRTYHARNGSLPNARDTAADVGCAVGTLITLPAWRALTRAREKGWRPRALCAAGGTWDATAERRECEPLAALIREQHEDAEQGRRNGEIRL
jgi:hypothetical protein